MIPADEDSDEEDLGVFDLELIAERFPAMTLNDVLEAEKRFMAADEDRSGVGGEIREKA